LAGIGSTLINLTHYGGFSSDSSIFFSWQNFCVAPIASLFSVRTAVPGLSRRSVATTAFWSRVAAIECFRRWTRFFWERAMIQDWDVRCWNSGSRSGQARCSVPSVFQC
jgi:hypothetical protein